MEIFDSSHALVYSKDFEFKLKDIGAQIVQYLNSCSLRVSGSKLDTGKTTRRLLYKTRGKILISLTKSNTSVV